jgi:chemotaxis protein methyltransferase CheR
MNDADCVAFLQWALPRLRMRWPGFRRVRNQVCKRIQRRMNELSCEDAGRYRVYLESHAGEWPILDALCRVTVTRFYRDRQAFAILLDEVLPELAGAALRRHADCLRIWCTGCASGEEPYTLAIAWQQELAARFPALSLDILATDADGELLRRADRACYAWSAVRSLPADWRAAAFAVRDERFCLLPAFRTAVRFEQQDVRYDTPPGGFDLICCRNLAFTYFDTALQIQVAERLNERLLPGGILLLGVRERPPVAGPAFEILSERLALFRRVAEGALADPEVAE